jgi:hypothetical protein
MQRSLRLILALPLLVVSSCGSSRGTPAGAPLPEGTWGGPHIETTVGPQSATLELDCAHGAIGEPIVVGRDGRFRVTGTYAAEHGGPTREGEDSGRPAVYTGRVEGETLSLAIAYEGGEEIGTFELVHGRPGRITKCL